MTNAPDETSGWQSPQHHVPRNRRITRTMGPRYAKACAAALALTQGQTSNEAHLDALNDFKGMLSRVIRNDQFDWQAVFFVLGEPTADDCRTVRDWVEDHQKRIKGGSNGNLTDPSAAQRLAERIAGRGLVVLKDMGFDA